MIDQPPDLENIPLTERLRWAWERWGTRAAIGTSFQGAGLVIIHHAVQAGLAFPVFTLDTGLLFEETLELQVRLEQFFGIRIESLKPDLTVRQQAAALGPELWARQPDTCCTIRKVRPLQKRLETLDCWITGLRREQSDTRLETGLLEEYCFDEWNQHNIFKLNPVADWSRDRVRAYLREHDIPTNPLSERGYRSIGCVPCTHPVGDGDSERAGRWTGFNKTECGIHTFLKMADKAVMADTPVIEKAVAKI